MRVTRILWLAGPAALIFTACTNGDGSSGRANEAPAVRSGFVDPALLEADQPGDPIGEGAAGARKGAGGFNGDGDFCDFGNCVATEGDCDSNVQCGGAVCLTDNGGRYADLTGARANQQDDHCAPATCNNFVQDPGEAGVDCGGPCGLCTPVCELPQHHAARCTYHCQCAGGSGDCDSNRDCQGWDNPNAALAAVCGADLGARFGGPGTNDYCVRAHCLNRVQDQDETGIDSGGSCGPANCAAQRLVTGTECTPSCPCLANEGDCDSNLDCAAGLVCNEQGAVDRCQPAGPVPGCGNGIRDPGEACDDGNAINDDACTNGCALGTLMLSGSNRQFVRSGLIAIGEPFAEDPAMWAAPNAAGVLIMVHDGGNALMPDYMPHLLSGKHILVVGGSCLQQYSDDLQPYIAHTFECWHQSNDCGPDWTKVGSHRVARYLPATYEFADQSTSFHMLHMFNPAAVGVVNAGQTCHGVQNSVLQTRAFPGGGTFTYMALDLGPYSAGTTSVDFVQPFLTSYLEYIRNQVAP